MPHIIVVADSEQDRAADAVMLSERISASDLESQHFATRLLERLEWAVEDAHEAEPDIRPAAPTNRPPVPGGRTRHRGQLSTGNGEFRRAPDRLNSRLA